MILIHALHIFSVSYFTGNVKITTRRSRQSATAKKPAANARRAASTKDGEAAQPRPAERGGGRDQIVAPKRPTCSPSRRSRSTNAIKAYVAAAEQMRPANVNACCRRRPRRRPATGGSN